MIKRTKMTLDQHREFGSQVKVFRRRLMQSHIMNVRNKSSKVFRAVWKAERAIGELCNQMDNVVCSDFPECEDATRIYYGKDPVDKDTKSENESATTT